MSTTRRELPSREPTAVRLAVVFGGGGSRGAFEVGIIHGLASRGIVPDLLVGSSVGAINAAYWGFHPEPAAGLRLLEFWKDATTSITFRAGWLDGMRQVLRRQNHLARSDALVHLLGRAFPGPAHIEDSRIPTLIVAADLSGGQCVRLKSGPLIEALLASCAIPGLYPPVRIDGRLLIDGGVLANCDVQAPLEEGATDVIAVDLSSEAGLQEPLTLWTLVQRAAGMMLRQQSDLVLAGARERSRILMVRPVFDPVPRISGVDYVLALFEAGHVAGRQIAAQHLHADRHVGPGELSSPVFLYPLRTSSGPSLTNAWSSTVPQLSRWALLRRG